MKARTVTAFGAQHHNEDAHAEHVTRLALKLFDRLRTRFDLPRSDRRLLETACRLHDIGYYQAPDSHVTESATLIAQTPLQGFSADERRELAAIVLLHSRMSKKVREHSLVRALPDQRRVLRLAAFLRVADGLDHGHIQNVQLGRIARGPRQITVRLRGESRCGNAPWAQAKADLWERVFGIPIVFRGAPPAGIVADFHRVLADSRSLLETARRLLAHEFRILDENWQAAMQGDRPEPLHDLRVALRRTEFLLRVFDVPLSRSSARSLRKNLGRLNDRLSPIRDADVWHQLLQQMVPRRRWKAKARYASLLRKETARRHQALLRLRRLLKSKRYEPLRADARYFLRIELPDLIRSRPPASVRPLAEARLWKSIEQLSRHERVTAETDPDELHDLRKICRRTRYGAEFFAPVLGARVRKLAGLFQMVTSPLGKIHDVDVGLQHLRRGGKPFPRRLRRALLRFRAESWDRFETHWRKARRSPVFRVLSAPRTKGRTPRQ